MFTISTLPFTERATGVIFVWGKFQVTAYWKEIKYGTGEVAILSPLTHLSDFEITPCDEILSTMPLSSNIAEYSFKASALPLAMHQQLK